MEGRGTVYRHAKGKTVLYLPVAVVRDSAFPFAVGDHVQIRIDDDRLIVEEYEEE